MLGPLKLYLKGMRIMMFQLFGFCYNFKGALRFRASRVHGFRVPGFQLGRALGHFLYFPLLGLRGSDLLMFFRSFKSAT